jgi:dienelactone hydrolase
MALRWQLRPLCLAVLFVGLGICGMSLPLQQHSGDKAAGGILALLPAVAFSLAAICALISVMAVWLLPPYVDLNIEGCVRRFQHVGFTEHELELPSKTTQDGEMVERPSQRFRLRIYYPAAAAAGTQSTTPSGGLLSEEGGGPAVEPGKTGTAARHMSRDDWYALSKVTPEVPLPGFVYSHLGEMAIDAAENAPRHAEAVNLPLIVFSHGLSAVPDVHWSVVSSLVRAGYVVAALTHNDGSAANVTLNDGSKFPYETGEMICTAAGYDLENVATERPAMEATVKAHRCRQLRRRVAEMSCACDYVLGNPGPVPVQVDPARITFAGHSFGGATAFLASELDERATCCVAYDPWLETTHPVHPKYQQAGMRRCPGLHFMSSDWEGGDIDLNLSAMLSEKRLHAASKRRVLEDTGHQSYTDFALLAPMVLRKLGMLGTADSRLMFHTMLTETLEFIHEATEAALPPV